MSFFLGSWEKNRSAEQTNRVNREAILVQFVCSALRFISHEPRKKDRSSRDLFVPHCDLFPIHREKKTLIPYIYNASNKDPFLNSPRKVRNSNFPQKSGT